MRLRQSRGTRFLQSLGLLAISLLAGPLIRAWFATLRCRYKVLGGSPRAWPADRPCIIAGWHDTLILTVWFLGPRRFHALISQSGDGEIIARVCSSLGLTPIRGSSSRGGASALREILRAARRVHDFRIAFAVDGPRGPSRRCKDGAVYLASRLGIPIVPIGAFAEHGWRMRSWDRFLVPKPFSRAAIVADEAICIPPNLDAEGLERHCRLIDSAIDRAETNARQLALRLPLRPSTDSCSLEAA